MKIIKKQDVSNWSYKHTCLTCESELEVEADDLIYNHYDGDMREPGYTVYQFACPVCQIVCDLDPMRIPKLIQINTKNKHNR